MSWEYPMSREEKKNRIMYLFEEELAEVRESRLNLEVRADEKHLSHHNASIVAAECPWTPHGKPERRSSPFVYLASCLAIAIIFLVLLTLACWRLSLLPTSLLVASPQVGQLGACEAKSVPASTAANTSGADNVTHIAAANASNYTATLEDSQHVFATVRTMWDWGLTSLRLSKCLQAEQWFAHALNLFQQHFDVNTVIGLDVVNGSGMRQMPPQISMVAIDYDELTADLGFALVCAERYKEGASLLLRKLESKETALTSLPWTFNALGYAHFHLKEYTTASDMFQLAAQTDDSNPLAWSNLAAVQMVQGNLNAADDAMLRAMECHEADLLKSDGDRKKPPPDSLMQNIGLLAAYSSGQRSRMPTLELWYP